MRVARGHPRHLPRDRLRGQEGLPTLPRCSSTDSTTAVQRLRVHGTVADPHERLGGHRDDERADGTPVDQREPLLLPPLPSSPSFLSRRTELDLARVAFRFFWETMWQSVDLSDGPVCNSTGRLFFYLTTMDETASDALKNPLVSFTVTEASIGPGGCGQTDAEDPTCAKVKTPPTHTLVAGASPC